MRALKLCFLVISFGLAGCSGVTRIHNPAADQDLDTVNAPVPYDQGTKTTKPKNVAIFFDGTGNDFNTTTNIARLYHLTINQNRKDIAAFYTSGVGADRTGPAGLATGLGFREDVQSAYRFLSEHYAGQQDKIHLYGYSRGAFSARALAGFVYTVGLIEFDKDMDPERRDEAIHDLFTAYKFARDIPIPPDCHVREQAKTKLIERRRCTTAKVLKEYDLTAVHKPRDVRFAMVGLWDTVETLGLPGRDDDPDHVNPNYSDQICNMDKVSHAVSLHDNRAGPYTPVLMTRRRLVVDCDVPDTNLIRDRVNEVWFAGDHGQIGGTEPLGYLSGVSLNWMLKEAAGIGVNGSLFPKTAQVAEDRFDFVKDAQAQSPLFKLFDRRMRDLPRYADQGDAGEFREGSAVDGMQVHISVKERINKGPGGVRQLRRARDGEKTKGLPWEEERGQIDRLSCHNQDPEECRPVKFKYVTQ